MISNASTVLLPRLCGAGYASELMLTGRLIGANEAFDNGLLNAVVEPVHLEASVHALAEEIASRAPLAVRATKRLLVEVLGPAVERAMARETEALVRLASTADMREGFAAFREKRSPSFSANRIGPRACSRRGRPRIRDLEAERASLLAPPAGRHLGLRRIVAGAEREVLAALGPRFHVPHRVLAEADRVPLARARRLRRRP